MSDFRGVLHGVTELPGCERPAVDGQLAEEMIAGFAALADHLEAGGAVETTPGVVRVTRWRLCDETGEAVPVYGPDSDGGEAD